MKTCMYLRKSRAEDLSDSTGDTLRRHRETLEETARAMQLTICGVYEELSAARISTRGPKCCACSVM